jgi:hypothetical protein
MLEKRRVARGRPSGSVVDPMTHIMRQTYNPDRMAALLALMIIDERKSIGLRTSQAQAIDLAVEEFPRRFGAPRRLGMTVHIDGAGHRVFKLEGKPAVLNRDKIADLLDRCRVTRTTLAEFQQWRPHVVALPYKITR